MKASVDAEACIGCAACEGICPDVFEMSDDDLAVVKVDEVPPAAEADCKEAAEQCPVEAIKIES